MKYVVRVTGAPSKIASPLPLQDYRQVGHINARGVQKQSKHVLSAGFVLSWHDQLDTSFRATALI